MAGGLEATDRSGDADAGRRLGRAREDRCGHAGDADGRLLVLEGDATFDDLVQLAAQHRPVHDGAR